MATTKNGNTTAYPAGRQSHESFGLTKREYFVALAMQSIIQVKTSQTGVTTYELAKNDEDVCGDIAAASITVADTVLKHLGG